MKKILLMLGISVMLGACSVSRDGATIGFSTGPNASQIAKARSEMEQNAVSTTAKKAVNNELTKNSRGGLVMIGDVGALRQYDHEDAVKSYKTYTKSAANWHPEHTDAFMSEADYVGQVAGWTSVEIYSIPGIISTRVPAQVPFSVLKSIAFPSTLASYFVQKTGDLVVGVSNDDGWVFITKVLCKDSFSQDGGNSYRTCAADYQRGRFDASTGKELDSDLAVKKDGAAIDPVTYKSLMPATTASK